MLRAGAVISVILCWSAPAAAAVGCPAGTPADVCRIALAEAADVERGLAGVNVSAGFAEYLRTAPEERFQNSPCYYRVLPSLEVQITRCAQTAVESLYAFVGRWFTGDAAVCDAAPGEAIGLLTYSETRFIGYENECLVASIAPHGRGHILDLACSGEGSSYLRREYVEVQGSALLWQDLTDTSRQMNWADRCPR